jgi:uncharacterized protein
LYPREYIQFLVHFHGDRDYFECHEILEEYWKSIDPGNKESIWVGLIQLAVSCYHHRRQNFKGAKKTLEKAVKIFSNEKDTLLKLGLNGEKLKQKLMERLLVIVKEETYQSFNLPIIDPLLLRNCLELANTKDLNWGNESDLRNNCIIHKHKLRDRTYVIEERNQALHAKKGNE